jgi:hypothetical protein
MDNNLNRLQAEKSDLEKQLKGMLAQDFAPYVYTAEGKRVYTTQENIETVRATLAQIETDIKREAERE